MDAWRDVTNYSKGHAEPSVWELKFPAWRVLVHRSVQYDGSPLPSWYMTCEAMDVRCNEIGDVTGEEAKAMALAWVRRVLKTRLSQIDNTL